MKNVERSSDCSNSSYLKGSNVFHQSSRLRRCIGSKLRRRSLGSKCFQVGIRNLVPTSQGQRNMSKNRSGEDIEAGGGEQRIFQRNEMRSE